MPRKRKVGRPRKNNRRKQQGGAIFTAAASLLTPVAIEVIGKSIATKKPVVQVLADKFK